MPECGSQCWLCDLPVRYDSYEGCTHDCKYCFVRRKSGLEVKMGETTAPLIAFIKGERKLTLNAFDWDIPIHWGGMSDPFQPCEKKYKRSLDALKVFAETKYPVIISTKGRLCIQEPYLSLIRECNVVMQVSILCSKYDELERGAPPFEERLKIVETLAQNTQRVICRAQPYVHDIFPDMMENVKRFADAGAYGVIFEGMKFAKKKPGLVRSGGDWVQKKELLQSDFTKLRDECHKHGLRFFAGENRLRKMGDSLTCCGIEGIEGFTPNTFNLNHLMNGDITEPTEAQRKPGTAGCFKSIFQTSDMNKVIKESSFEGMIRFVYENNRPYVDSVMKG